MPFRQLGCAPSDWRCVDINALLLFGSVERIVSSEQVGAGGLGRKTCTFVPLIFIPLEMN